MKKFIIITVLTILTATVAPGYAFIDYLFGGSQSRNAIDNSALGDLRAWWTGNPAYQFNPFYSGGANPAQQGAGMTRQQGMQQSFSPRGMQQGPAQPQPQANVTYFPPQASQPQQQYGYGAAPAQQRYQGQPIYGAQGASLPYQGPPQQYQQAPQQYQQPAQQYQQPAQQYQRPAQQYQQPAQQYQQPAQR